MAGVNRRPPSDGVGAARVQTYRQARLVTTRLQRLAEREEEQLRELDDAVGGSDRDELQELRAESEAGATSPAASPEESPDEKEEPGGARPTRGPAA